MKKELDFDKIFDNIFSSVELGCKKPEPEFFQKILNELGAKGKEILFFDGKKVNIEVAKNFGIKSFLWDRSQLQFLNEIY